MKIGLLSDTHDNLPHIDKAVLFFNRQKVDFVLHAGDFVAPFSVLRLKTLHCDWRGVFGNNDGERTGLTGVSQGKITEAPLRLKLGGIAITLVHDLKQLDLKREGSRLVVCGHTHKPEIIIQPEVTVINPGECGGWLTGESTVSIVELPALRAELFKI
ncbi:MAG: metallophosphoesterase [Candidatus Omnitrophota bacterium]